MFAFGLAFTMAMLLFLCIQLSRLTQEKDGLTREIAFLRLELEELRDAKDGVHPAGGDA